MPACLLCRGQLGPLQIKVRASAFLATHESLVVQVRLGRANDPEERGSLGSMADTRSLDSFQSLMGTRQASKRNRARAPCLENLRCGNARCRPMKAGWDGGAAQALPILGVQPPQHLPLMHYSGQGRGRRRRSAWGASTLVQPAHGLPMTAYRGPAWPCLGDHL